MEEAVFLDLLKDQTKDRTEAGSIDHVLHNEPGTGNLHMVQMVYQGKFEVSEVVIWRWYILTPCSLTYCFLITHPHMP